MYFSEEIEDLLQSKDYAKLLDIVFNPENIPKIQAFGMDLITRICECGLAFCMDLDSLRACQDMLMHVVRCVRPKEALIGLLEQAEIFVHSKSDKFSSLLAPLQFVMLNLPKKREHSLSWVLSILNSHMKSQHKFPAKLNAQLIRGKEAFLMEETPEIKDTLTTYKEFCNFYEPFVCQFWVERNKAMESKDAAAITSSNHQQEILRDHLVQLLGDPLLHFDLHWEEQKKEPPADKEPDDSKDKLSEKKIKTDARLISERIMGFLRLVDQHPEYFYSWVSRKLFLEQSNLSKKPVYVGDDDSDDADADESIIDFSSVVNYMYLIYCESINIDIMPSSVLSPTYVFISTVRLMSNILGNSKASPISLLKCFVLARNLLSKIDESVPGLRLEAELLETPYLSDFVEWVAYHVVYCEALEVRKEGLQVLREMMWKFEPKGRYDFILFVFNRVEHDGVKGYIITQLKDCIRVALDTKKKEMKDFFTGMLLLRQLRLTCVLKDGVTTDLMENKEQIMCALNLVLYIVIRDKTANLTGITEILPEIEKKLLDPLFKALELSRAHYQMKLKEMNDPKAFEEQLKEQKKLTESMDLVLNEETQTPETLKITMEEQKQSLNTALGTFDMMNGILARVNAMCETLKKAQSNTTG